MLYKGDFYLLHKATTFYSASYSAFSLSLPLSLSPVFFHLLSLTYDRQSLLAVFDTPSPYMFNWNIPYKVAIVMPKTDARAGNRADLGT
jgi:hypothetical protein